MSGAVVAGDAEVGESVCGGTTDEIAGEPTSAGERRDGAVFGLELDGAVGASATVAGRAAGGGKESEGEVRLLGDGARTVGVDGETAGARSCVAAVDGSGRIDAFVGGDVVNSAGRGTVSLAIGRGWSEGDGSVAGGADFSPPHVGSTGQQQLQQRRLASNRQAEAGSAVRKQTLVQTNTKCTIFRNRFIAEPP